MINAKLNGVARTLALTLRARTDEQHRDAPLIHDPWSVDWLAYLPTYDDYERWYNPAFQLATVIRSRLIDDAVSQFIDSHDMPLVVELGAGFSSRYYRLGEGRTQWIEMDFEDAVVVRRKLDVETANHWFLPGDMTNSDWLDKLPESQPENILFIAEGVLMFLEADRVEALIHTLRECYPGASWIFDVVNPGYIAHVADQFEKLRAPMRWGITETELPSLGFNVKHSEYLLLEYPERWEEIGVDASVRTTERSGFVVEAILT